MGAQEENAEEVVHLHRSVMGIIIAFTYQERKLQKKVGKKGNRPLESMDQANVGLPKTADAISETMHNTIYSQRHFASPHNFRGTQFPHLVPQTD